MNQITDWIHINSSLTQYYSRLQIDSIESSERFYLRVVSIHFISHIIDLCDEFYHFSSMFQKYILLNHSLF